MLHSRWSRHSAYLATLAAAASLAALPPLPPTDPTVAFALGGTVQPESAGALLVDVQLDAPAVLEVSVPFTVAGTASNGNDYTIDLSPVVIPPGFTSGSIPLTIIDDFLSEGAETIKLVMGTPTNAVVGAIERHLLVIEPSDVLLQGKGSRAPTALPLTIGPESIAFPSTRVGESGGPVQVLVRNLTGSPLTLTAAGLIGRHAGQFSLQLPGPLPLVLPHLGSVTLDVGFVPSERGLLDATLRLQQVPYAIVAMEIPLTGVGIGPTNGEILVNSGGSKFLDEVTQEPWVKDYGYAGSSVAISNQGGEINAPANRHLYRSAREGLFAYGFGLPNGTYDVTLHFAELEMGAAGLRVFDVLAEGQVVIQGLDLYAVAGPRTAYTETHRITLSDGQLSLAFRGTIDQALVNAIEVRSVGVFQALPATLDFGVLAPGQHGSLPLTLANVSLHPLHVTSLQIELLTGDGSEFTVDIDGTLYPGGSQTLNYVLDRTLGGGEQLMAEVRYDPLEHAYNDLRLHFGGDFGPEGLVDVHGDAGIGGDPYLHPVITVESVAIDYDSDGFADVLLNGSDSHTHEPGKQIVAWEWRENGNLVSSLEQDTQPFTLGPHTVELTIYDDNVPPHSLATTADFEVRPVTSVPGVLALYYPATLPVTASALLDAVPANAEYAEMLANLHVDNQTGIGGSGLQTNTMVRLLACFEVPFGRGYEFSITGGVDHRLEIDGNPFQGPAVLDQGMHTIEVRWAVNSLIDLPLDVQVAVDGGSFGAFDPSELTHDQLAAPPVINSMPAQGIAQGGNQIVISGFGFFPSDEVTVHWGGMSITEASFTHWSAQEIEFLSPAGIGTIQVTVETPHGTSNAKTFEYTSSGPIPVVFVEGPFHAMSQPTAMAWGPDGRLYVASRGGTIKAITYNEDYSVASNTTYPGVSGLYNHEIMGLAFNPYDPLDPVKIYVAHNEMYAQGGGAFVGPAPYPGQVSVLTGPGFATPVPLITNLPTSNHDHGVNGMLFDNNGDLLIQIGGNTNAGVKHPQIGDLPESPLSGAIVKAHLSRPDFNGDLIYLETGTGLVNNDQVAGEIVDLAPGTHVTLHSTGIRNGFDLALTTWGFLYTSDNGPNNGFGEASTGPSTQTTTHPSDWDELLLVEYDHYYGHPNRNRGRYEAIENVYFGTSAAAVPGFTKQLKTLASSHNGIFEYRADAFQGAMRGELLVQKWNSQLSRLKLSADKKSVASTLTLPNVTKGLDTRQGPGGALVAGDYSGNKVRTFLPNDAGIFGATVYDIFPWRAPATGGTPFVIGGHNFGTLANTSVTFDDIPATLTSVTSQRIRGIVPAHPSPTQSPVNVLVTVGGVERNHASAFQYLPTLAGKWLGRWESGPNMPNSLGEVAAGVINGKLYVVGESNDNTLAYDLIAMTWSNNLTKRPFKGHHHSAEVYNGKWYLIGGLSAGQGKVQIYDPVANSWSSGADMPWAAGSVCTALIGNKIYAAGGIVASATVDDCAVYDIDANTWTPLASMPFEKGRNHAATGTDGQKVYVFGGRGVGSGSNNVVANGFDHVQIYDPATDTWTASFDPGSPIQPLPIGRGGTGKAVFYKGEFYVIGGETLNGPGAQAGNVYNRVDVYDPVANTWRLEAKLPTPRHGIFPVVYQGKIYVAGGGVNAGFSSSNVLEIYSRQ